MAVIVIFVSYKIGKKAIDVLLDKAPLDTVEKVHKTLATFSEIKHTHNVKVRTAGADTFIKLNIHLDPDLSLRQVHEICDKIEQEVCLLIQRSEVYIHAEPHDKSHLEIEKDN